MNKDTLSKAIQVGQITRLLALASDSDAYERRLSRLRARVDEEVAAAALGDAAAAQRAEIRLTEIESALVAAMLQHFNIGVLVRRACGEKPTGSMLSKPARLRSLDTSFFSKVEAIAPEPKPVDVVLPATSAKSQLTPLQAARKAKQLVNGQVQQNRARLLRAFNSAVRNSPWLPTLLRLEVKLDVATRLGEDLWAAHGSGQGRALLEKNLHIVCPPAGTAKARTSRSKKVAVKADGLYTTQVVFTAEKLLAVPDIAALAAVRTNSAAAQDELAKLLVDATTAVPLLDGASPDVVAQRVVDELVAGLVARKKAIDAEEATARAKAQEALQMSAVDELQKLDPKLLAALKANPELLQRV